MGQAQGKTLLGLVILGGLWLASAAARDYFFMMNPLRGLGDTQPLPMWMEAVSSLFMLLIFEGAHFLGFAGLLCVIAWITGACPGPFLTSYKFLPRNAFGEKAIMAQRVPRTKVQGFGGALLCNAPSPEAPQAKACVIIIF